MTINFIKQPKYPIISLWNRRQQFHTYDHPDCFHQFAGSLCVACGFNYFLKQKEDSIEYLEPMDA